MSTLTVSNIKATGETASRAVSGVAAAWVNFNGTGTIAARDSFNVASLTDNATGDTTVNFTTVMANANYAHAGNSGGAEATSNGAVYAYEQGTVRTASLFRVLTFLSSATDTPNINIHVMGDLA